MARVSRWLPRVMFLKACHRTPYQTCIKNSFFPLWIACIRIHRMNQYHLCLCVMRNPLTELKQSLNNLGGGLQVSPFFSMLFIFQLISALTNPFPFHWSIKMLSLKSAPFPWLPSFFGSFCSHTGPAFLNKLLSNIPHFLNISSLSAHFPPAQEVQNTSLWTRAGLWWSCPSFHKMKRERECGKSGLE